jgi:hypothetical protein
VKGDLPDQLALAAGLDVGVTSRLTLAADVLARRVIHSPRVSASTFEALDGHSTFADIAFARGQSFDVVDAALGLKLNVAGRLLVDGNVVLKLNDAGLRDKATPLVGIEYTF